MGTFVTGPITWPQANASAPSAAQIDAMITGIVDSLVGAGMVQTGDTGQMIPGSPPAWPAQGVSLGYLVFRFSDSQQATDPIFLKFEIIRHTISSSGYRLQMSFGQGSNGSGTLTGTLLTPAVSAHNNNQTGGTFAHYCSFNSAGSLFFMFMYGQDSTVYNAHTQFSFERSRTAAGAYDGLGGSLVWGSRGAYWRHQSVRWIASPGSPTVYSLHNSGCLVPNLPANTALLNGDKQLYPHFYNIPDIRQRWSSFTVRKDEFPGNPTSFTATAFNGETRTYLSPGSATGSLGAAGCNAADDANFVPCFTWE